MDVKISVTTNCNAKCKTCPCWAIPGETMSLENFKTIWDKLNNSEFVSSIMLNNTGDMYTIPNSFDYFTYIESNKKKPVLMTTNAGAMQFIPRIDQILISFNGYDKESYERIVGLSFEQVVNNIRAHYPVFNHMRAEIHHLVFEETAGHEREFFKLWEDFPGRLRLSYKYDNQGKKDKTVDKFEDNCRVPCDYLWKLNITPSGKLISCAHDFRHETDFGNLLEQEISDILPNIARAKKQAEHKTGLFTGLCEKCNYNVPDTGKVFYIKG